jgi:Ras-related GTP-binding protein A/B
MQAAGEEKDKIEKVLLMGRQGAGKTSMRSIIFANYLARDAYRITFTNDVNKSRVRFLGNLVLSLWDCGGQDLFMEQYFQSQRENIFKNVQVLIYVFDVTSKDFNGELQYYENCLNALTDLSPKAKIFCLVHKLDLLAESMREKNFQEKRMRIIEKTKGFEVDCFKTSIWDETLYKAWSQIVYYLLPNVKTLEKDLGTFCKTLNADEVVLFERSTFLVISHHDAKQHEDVHRFEKISNIIKQFKLSCIKTNFQFQSMVVRNQKFTAFIDEFTSSTYIMVIVSDPDIEQEAIALNIKASKEHFESIVMSSL